jgi:hypothetical protein
LIGFGDPIFSKAEAEAAEQQTVAAPVQIAAITRGFPLNRRSSPQLEGVDSAELALLPRPPDTAEELKAIARALEVDPSKVLKLGVVANERTVKTTDPLRSRRVFCAGRRYAAEMCGQESQWIAVLTPIEPLVPLSQKAGVSIFFFRP